MTKTTRSVVTGTVTVWYCGGGGGGHRLPTVDVVVASQRGCGSPVVGSARRSDWYVVRLTSVMAARYCAVSPVTTCQCSPFNTASTSSRICRTLPSVALSSSALVASVSSADG